MQCVHCGAEFNPREKVQRARQRGLPAGKINECLDCADSDEVRKTGVMIYTGEGMGQVQINADPKLTKLLNTRRWETAGSIQKCGGGTTPLRITKER